MREALASYRLLLLWQIRRNRSILALLVLIQAALGLGIVYGLSFLLPRIDPVTALYLSTGAPTLTLLLLGLSVVPQEVAQSRLTGEHEYISALPVPRLAPLAAGITYWLGASLPGTAIALLMASARFDFRLDVSPLVVPAFLLVAFTASSVGYAMASAFKPEVTSQVTSFISLGILLFSPIDFPVERLPEFLEAVHRILPIKYMGDLIRWALTGSNAESPLMAFAVVTAWCGVCLAISARVATRRR